MLNAFEKSAWLSILLLNHYYKVELAFLVHINADMIYLTFPLLIWMLLLLLIVILLRSSSSPDFTETTHLSDEWKDECFHAQVSLVNPSQQGVEKTESFLYSTKDKLSTLVKRSVSKAWEVEYENGKYTYIADQHADDHGNKKINCVLSVLNVKLHALDENVKALAHEKESRWDCCGGVDV